MNTPNQLAAPCQVKVCGIRDPAEAQALDAMGVDWLGFNFHPGSPRYVDPEAAAAMIGSLTHSVPAGVFVDAPVEQALRIIAVTGIKAVQLHGSEDWDYVRRMPIPVIKAVPHDRLADLGGLMDGLAAAGPSGAAPLAYYLIDTAAAGSFGGSGIAFDWAPLRQYPPPLPFFLAGGLGPHNLAEAIVACAPFAVDLNSKVEVSPGRKDL